MSSNTLRLSDMFLRCRSVWLDLGIQRTRTMTSGTSFVAAPPPRTYASTAFYSSNVCMTVSLTPPKFQRRSSYTTLTNPGTILFEFVARDSSGKFDWSVKERVGLVPHEIAMVLSMRKPFVIARSERVSATKPPHLNEPEKPVREIQFFPAPEGRCIIQLETRDSLDVKKLYEMPMTPADFLLLKQLMTWALPRLTGWERVYQSQGDAVASDSADAVPEPVGSAAPAWKSISY